MLFSRPNRAVGLDIGTYSVKAVQMSAAGGRLRVDRSSYALVDRNEANVDPLAAQANALREALRTIPLMQSIIVGALPGQTVVIRYPRLPDMPDDQVAAAIEAEAGQHIPYERSEVYMDTAPLCRVSDENTTTLKAILVAAKHEVIAKRAEIAQAAEIQFSILGVDSLALLDAAEVCDFLRMGESVALVNFGSNSTSIHFVKDGVSNFIRDVNWGARELIVAISKARRCEFADAERLLFEAAREQELAAAEPIEEPPPPPAPAPAKGASLLDPLDDELGGLDDLGGPPAPAAKPSAPAAHKNDLREVLAAPLTRLVNEIRRSFDYYEQQLYEKPVDRMIVSGGIAQLHFLGETLVNELSVDHVEVADPAASSLVMGNPQDTADLRAHPAAFMVAVGLAARGVMQL